MSVDYDRLRQLVAEMEQGVAVTTRYIWLDLSRELLRMRDRLENLTDRLAILHDEARVSGNHNGADAYDFAMQEIERIREGDWTN